MKKKIFIAILFVSIMALQGCTAVYEDASDMAAGWKSKVKQISVAGLRTMTDSGENIVIIDVREEGQYSEGNIPGSVNISRGVLEESIGNPEFWAEQYMYPPEKDSKIIICSQNGDMGILAAVSLAGIGYKSILNLEGGYESYLKQQN